MRVTVIGANGFVGSAFVRLLRNRPGIETVAVTRQNFETIAAEPSDVVIEAACNSKKFLADQNPVSEFDASVTHRLRTLNKFPATLHLHVSSVDVYGDLTTPASTREDTPIDVSTASRYGFHKFLAEQLVQHYASSWLIVRLAGMIGPGLRKNPVFDILNGHPLRVHPDSRYQYMLTDEVARHAWHLVESGCRGEIFNICGQGLITMREIADLARRELNLSALSSDGQPRVVEASNEKISRLVRLSSTRASMESFLKATGREDLPSASS